MADPKGVEAVDRALRILECFGPGETSLSLAELSRSTGLYKSTILRLAVSLERFGYVARAESGQFRLGPSAGRLGAAFRQGFDLEAILRPALRSLSLRTGETASFYVSDKTSRICLFRVEPPRAIRHAIDEGARLPLNIGASGKVLRAFAEATFDRAGFDGAAFDGAEQIRSDGYATSLGERDPEVASVAVPLHARNGHLVGAIAVSGLISRFDTRARHLMITALEECRADLAAQIDDRDVL